MDRDANGFGERLRWWRDRRGPSQLALAGALDLPLRQQNALLLAAGFAPAWRERDLAAPELAEVSRALTFMLDQQEPYPAFVVDRRWNLLRANAGAGRLVAILLGPAPPPAPGAPPPNLAEPCLRRMRCALSSSTGKTRRGSSCAAGGRRAGG
jgi:hypothetical protein